MNKTTQQQRIITMLKSGKKTSADFYKEYMPRFSARIHELRNKGYDIRRSPWRDHMFVYELKEEKVFGDEG